MHQPISQAGPNRSYLTSVVLFLGALGVQCVSVQSTDNLSLIQQLIVNESNTARQNPLMVSTSVERSDRTDGHLWTEHVAEVSGSKLRYLIAEDGTPLSSERCTLEVNRPRKIGAYQSVFIAEERARKDDEQHARQMLNLLPRAFTFERLEDANSYIHMRFKPDPKYIPQTYEGRVFHAISGNILIDRNLIRLHRLEGSLDANVTFGIGVLAVIHRGSRFSITRDPVQFGVWKTQQSKLTLKDAPCSSKLSLGNSKQDIKSFPLASRHFNYRRR